MCSEGTNQVVQTIVMYVLIMQIIQYIMWSKVYIMYVGPLSNLRKNEMHLGKQPKLINHGNPVSDSVNYHCCVYIHYIRTCICILFL